MRRLLIRWRGKESKEGIRYLQQLNLDHTHDFDILLKIKRLNDTSFKLIYGDVKGNQED